MQRSCRHLLVDEFQDLTPAHVLLLRLLGPARRSTCSASATTTSASTATPAPTRRSSSTTAAVPRRRGPPAARSTTAARSTWSTARRTLLGYNHRRVAKEIVRRARRPTPPPGALAIVDARAPTRRRDAPGRRSCSGWLDEPGSSRRRSPCSPGSTRCCWPRTSPSTRPASRSRSVLHARRARAHRVRAALAYLRIATNPDGARRRATSSRSCAGRAAACRSGSPSGSPAAALDASARLAGARRPGARQGRGQGARPRRRPRASCVDAGRAGTTRERPRGRPRRRRPGRGDEPARPDAAAGRGRATSTTSRACSASPTSTPTPATFEPWLRAAFQREADPGGVTLSTIHRVKGLEWDRVVVFGVSDGHRAPPPGRGRRGGAPGAARGDHPGPPPRRRARRPHRAASPFLDELAGAAPHRPAPDRRDVRPQPLATSKPVRRAAPDVMAAELSGALRRRRAGAARLATHARQRRRRARLRGAQRPLPPGHRHRPAGVTRRAARLRRHRPDQAGELRRRRSSPCWRRSLREVGELGVGHLAGLLAEDDHRQHLVLGDVVLVDRADELAR